MDVALYTYVDKARFCVFQFGICHVRESSTFKRTTILYILERVRVVQCSCGDCINTLARFCDGDQFADFLVRTLYTASPCVQLYKVTQFLPGSTSLLFT